MITKEWRIVTIYYCDLCGSECGLPFYGGGTDGKSFGYGKCCATNVFNEEQQKKRHDRTMKAIKGSLFF